MRCSFLFINCNQYLLSFHDRLPFLLRPHVHINYLSVPHTKNIPLYLGILSALASYLLAASQASTLVAPNTRLEERPRLWTLKVIGVFKVTDFQGYGLSSSQGFQGYRFSRLCIVFSKLLRFLGYRFPKLLTFEVKGQVQG